MSYDHWKTMTPEEAFPSLAEPDDGDDTGDETPPINAIVRAARELFSLAEGQLHHGIAIYRDEITMHVDDGVLDDIAEQVGARVAQYHRQGVRWRMVAVERGGMAVRWMGTHERVNE